MAVRNKLGQTGVLAQIGQLETRAFLWPRGSITTNSQRGNAHDGQTNGAPRLLSRLLGRAGKTQAAKRAVGASGPPGIGRRGSQRWRPRSPYPPFPAWPL